MTTPSRLSRDTPPFFYYVKAGGEMSRCLLVPRMRSILLSPRNDHPVPAQPGHPSFLLFHKSSRGDVTLSPCPLVPRMRSILLSPRNDHPVPAQPGHPSFPLRGRRGNLSQLGSIMKIERDIQVASCTMDAARKSAVLGVENVLYPNLHGGQR